MATPTSLTSVIQRTNIGIRRIGRTSLLLVLLWTATLWWGERSIYESSVSACGWQRWESWSPDASPHHVLFVADPQLVDPHTYPGRPWPLSTLTVLYTDLYMRRVYGYLLDHLQPHSTIFLGDLFDGGREWAVADYQSPDDRLKRYGTSFWLKEYSRFMKLFIGGWYKNNWNGYLTGEGRRIIASLPGNHDLGIGGGIDEHVRDRFEAHFGPSNRIDILGNHTFVTLDTVSLSAMNQVDPKTGESGAGDGTGRNTKYMDIWKPVEGFLIDVKNRRDKAVERRYEYLQSTSGQHAAPAAKELYVPEVTLLNDHDSPKVHGVMEEKKTSPVASTNFPTILMSHVPLYRDPGVACGPLREHGNAIPIAAGYQYQNVLTDTVSRDIIEHLDAEQVSMIYSGDDHDYCEIQHDEFTGKIREITVKSISWAMGVRVPGVQLASLWNPVDIEAISQGTAPATGPRDTVQNHLCLLPDQLAIFIRYGQILVLTLVFLLVRAVRYHPQPAYQTLSSSSPWNDKEKPQPLLPVSRRPTSASTPRLSPVTTNSSTPHHTARARSNGKLNGYGDLPASSRSASPTKTAVTSLGGESDSHTNDWNMPASATVADFGQPSYASSPSFSLSPPQGLHQYRHHYLSSLSSSLSLLTLTSSYYTTPASSRRHEFLRSMVVVAAPVVMLYILLISTG